MSTPNKHICKLAGFNKNSHHKPATKTTQVVKTAHQYRSPDTQALPVFEVDSSKTLPAVLVANRHDMIKMATYLQEKKLWGGAA